MKSKSTRGSKRILITFGGGSPEVLEAAARVACQAHEMGIFDEVKSLGPEHLSRDYWASFPSDWARKRGFGYWAWKAYVVLKQLEQLNSGDFLYYADAGCELNQRGKSRMLEYSVMSASSGGVLAFRQNYKHKEWCKEELGLALPFGLEAGQLSASFFVLQKNSMTSRLASDWWELCSRDGGLLIDDTTQDQRPDFREHRHDQAILHALLARERIELASPDETFMTPWHEFNDMPVLAARNRTGKSRLAELTGPPLVRLSKRALRVLTAVNKRLRLFG